MDARHSLVLLAQETDPEVSGVPGPWPLACCGLLAVVAAFAFWLWMLLDAIQRDFEGNEKVLWVLVIVLLQLPGAIVYLVFGRRRGRKRLT